MKPYPGFQIVARFGMALSVLFVFTAQLNAQSEVWTTPFPGHRVISNLYAVGTYDLGIFLV